jgi:SP family general alpha glucoside:H+ symporter-like MFS transporter
MEAYCVFLMGNYVALTSFQREYGIPDGNGNYVIETSWQSALQCGGPLGALIGVFLAGPITSKIGYRWATIGGLMVLNAFIFVMFFAKSLPIFFVSQLLEGIPVSDLSAGIECLLTLDSGVSSSPMLLHTAVRLYP